MNIHTYDHRLANRHNYLTAEKGTKGYSFQDTHVHSHIRMYDPTGGCRKDKARPLA